MPAPWAKLRVILEAILILYVYYCLIMVFLFVPPMALHLAGIHLGLRPGAAITLGGVVLAELIALGAVRAYYRRKGITIGELGWSIPRNTAVVVALSLFAAFLYIGYTMQIPEVRENIAEVSLLKLWGLVAGVMAALMEETIFRGYMLARFQQVQIAPVFQILLAALAFSLLHIGFGFVGILCTFVVGLALGGLYLLGQRNLLGPFLCHGLINAVIEPWLLLWLLKFYSERFAP